MSSVKQVAFFSLIILVLALAFFRSSPPQHEQWHLIYDTHWIVAAVILYTFFVGQISGNYSQVDKLWSLLPILYSWFMTYQAGWNDRMILMSVLITLWGVRLTYNFARRGAYQWKFWAGEEDYRWGILRQKPGLKHPLVWMLFNLLFICFYQNLLIFLFTLPVLGTFHTSAPPLELWDVILGLLFCVLLGIEFVADQQQYEFQTEKYRRIRMGEPLGAYSDGFVHTGLWAKVRHPNYAAEQGMWIIIYLFSVVATGELLNWTIYGVVLLVALFKGSSDFSESISAAKYPRYREYQQTTPRYLPF